MIAMRFGIEVVLRRIRAQPADGGLDVVQLSRKLHLRARTDRHAGDGVASRVELRRHARGRALARVRHPRRAAGPDHDGQRPGRAARDVEIELVAVAGRGLGRRVVEVGVRRGGPGGAAGPRPRPPWGGAPAGCAGACIHAAEAATNRLRASPSTTAIRRVIRASQLSLAPFTFSTRRMRASIDGSHVLIDEDRIAVGVDHYQVRRARGRLVGRGHRRDACRLETAAGARAHR